MVGEGRRGQLRKILDCPQLRRELLVSTLRAIQACAGIEVTTEQAEQVYDKAKEFEYTLTAEGGRALSRCRGNGCSIRIVCARYISPVDHRVWSAYQVCHLSPFLYLGHRYLVPVQSYEFEHFPSLILPL